MDLDSLWTGATSGDWKLPDIELDDALNECDVSGLGKDLPLVLPPVDEYDALLREKEATIETLRLTNEKMRARLEDTVALAQTVKEQQEELSKTRTLLKHAQEERDGERSRTQALLDYIVDIEVKAKTNTPADESNVRRHLNKVLQSPTGTASPIEYESEEGHEDDAEQVITE